MPDNYDYLEREAISSIIIRHRAWCIDAMQEFGYTVNSLADSSNEKLSCENWLSVLNHPTSSVSTWETAGKFGTYIMEPDLGMMAFKFARAFKDLADAEPEIFNIQSISKNQSIQLGFKGTAGTTWTIKQLAQRFVGRMFNL